MCAFFTSLTTTVFSQRSMWRFETVPHRTIPEGQQSSIFHRALIPPSDCLPTTRFLMRGALEGVMEEQIGQHGRYRGSLWGSPVSHQHGPVGLLHRRLEPPFDVQHHPRVLGVSPYRFDDEIPRHAVEELLDVQIDHPFALPAAPAARLDRVQRRTPR